MHSYSLTEIHAEIRDRFLKEGDPQRAESAKHYFREPIDSYGVSATFAKILAQEFAKKYSALSKEQWFDLCDLLWTSGKHEEGLMACHLTIRQKKSFEIGDFPRFEEWISTCVSNWAQCDTFCNHSMATYLEKFPQYLKNVALWTNSPNRWVQRASAVTFCIPAANGKWHSEEFAIAEQLLGSKDDMVQKGAGWLLKCIAQSDPEKVITFLRNHPGTPRLIVRYASEKMSKEQKERMNS